MDEILEAPVTIDDPQEVSALMARLQEHLPLAVFPSKDLRFLLREHAVKLENRHLINVTDVFYMGDSGGIACALDIPRTHNLVVVSLTHLRVPSVHPLAKMVAAYQAKRRRMLAAESAGLI